MALPLIALGVLALGTLALSCSGDCYETDPKTGKRVKCDLKPKNNEPTPEKVSDASPQDRYEKESEEKMDSPDQPDHFTTENPPELPETTNDIPPEKTNTPEKPVFVPLSSKTGKENHVLTFKVLVMDPNGLDNIEESGLTLVGVPPTGATFKTAKDDQNVIGTFTWEKPLLGTHKVVFAAKDRDGLESFMSVDIVIGEDCVTPFENTDENQPTRVTDITQNTRICSTPDGKTTYTGASLQIRKDLLTLSSTYPVTFIGANKHNQVAIKVQDQTGTVIDGPFHIRGYVDAVVIDNSSHTQLFIYRISDKVKTTSNGGIQVIGSSNVTVQGQDLSKAPHKIHIENADLILTRSSNGKVTGIPNQDPAKALPLTLSGGYLHILPNSNGNQISYVKVDHSSISGGFPILVSQNQLNHLSSLFVITGGINVDRTSQTTVENSLFERGRAYFGYSQGSDIFRNNTVRDLSVNAISGLGAVYFEAAGPGITIEGNRILNNQGAGIAVSGKGGTIQSPNCKIRNNTVTDNGGQTPGKKYAGIDVRGYGIICEVSGNTLSGSHIGIALFGEKHTVFHNIVKDNSLMGIWVFQDKMTVYENTVENNGPVGIEVYGSGNTIRDHQTINGTGYRIDNHDVGILIKKSADNNIISGNSMSRTRTAAMQVNSNNNTIKDNTCSGTVTKIEQAAGTTGNTYTNNMACTGP